MNVYRRLPIHCTRAVVRALLHDRAFRGKSRLVNAFESAVGRLAHGSDSVTARINGLPMSLDLAAGAHRDMFYGLYEEPEVRFMRRCLRKDSVFLDVGSSIGYYLAQAAGVLGSEGSIHCFEPIPEYFASLENSVRRSDLRARVFLNRVAVSDAAGAATMVVDGGQSRLVGGGGLRADTDPEIGRCQATQVTAITLDGYLKENSLGRIDFIKMDIEGHELRALRGLRHYFACGGRPTILTEVAWVSRTESQEAVGELFSFMGSLGYGAYRFRRTALVPVPAPDDLFGERGARSSGGRMSLNVAWVWDRTATRRRTIRA